MVQYVFHYFKGGWFSGLSGIIQKVIPRGPNEMILPDDTKKSVRSCMTHCLIAQCPSPLEGALFTEPN